MADPLYVRASGNWSDTATWSETDGGGAAARIPDAATDVYWTATPGAVSVTLGAGNVTCRNFICTGSVGTLVAGNWLTLAGSTATLSAAMTVGAVQFGFAYAGTVAFTAAGKAIKWFSIAAGCTVSNQDDLTCSAALCSGAFTANGHKVTLTSVGNAAEWIALSGFTGASSFYDLDVIPGTPASGQNLSLSGALGVTHDMTVNGGATYAMIIKGVGTQRALSIGGSLYMLNSTTFTDVAPTVSGTTSLTAGKTWKASYGLTHTSALYALTGTAVSPITLACDVAGSMATIAKSGGGTVTIQYATIDYLTGSPASTFYAYNSTDGGHNSQIYFVTTQTGSTNIDAYITKFVTQTGQFDLDAFIAENKTGTFSIDAIMAAIKSGLFYLDAYIETPYAGRQGAWDKPLDIITMYVSGNNLSLADDQFLFVKCATKKDRVVPAAAGDVPLGVNYGTGKDGQKVQIATGGVVKLRLASTVKRGNMLKVYTGAADGRATLSNRTRAYGAMALQNGDAGNIIAALLLQGHGS